MISELLVADSFTTETSWPYLISEFLVADSFTCNAASSWPRTFLHPRCFCLLDCIKAQSPIALVGPVEVPPNSLNPL